MKRREFLAAAGGVTLSAFSSRRVLGANDRLGVALIGSGRRGREVMKAFLASGRAELRCVADVYDVQRQRAREALGVTAPEAVAYEEALARPDVDAVLIGVPDHLHLPITLAALAAGKHVFMEKPTTHNLDEGARLVAAVKKSGKVCQTGTQQRSGAHYARAKAEYFDTKALGQVIFVRGGVERLPLAAAQDRARSRSLPASTGNGSWARRSRSRTTGSATTRGGTSPTTAAACWPTS